MNNTLKHFFFFLKLFTVFCVYLIEIPATAQLKTDTLESWKKGYLDRYPLYQYRLGVIAVL